MNQLILRARRVVTPGACRPASIYIADGRIVSVSAWDTNPGNLPVVDAGSAAILPGLVDTHVHINEPGRTEWEGFATATRAAAAGGVTTVLDMPLNSIPPTTSLSALEAKRSAARGKVAVDTGFIGGIVPGNTAAIGPLIDAGVLAFKCFLVPSGVDEFPAVTEADLRAALPALAARDIPLMVHAELPGPLAEAEAGHAGNPRRYRTWLDRRPARAEVDAVELLGRLALEYDARIHVVHLSSFVSVAVLSEAVERGARLTAETCPHYLTFAAEDIPDGATEFKCAPAIGGRANREWLWNALLEGRIGSVVSDHSPCPPALKARDGGDFLAAWGGIASLQLGLSAVWTGASERRVPLERLAEWMSAAPARLAGLDGRKGAIAAGYDADLVIFAPEETFVVDGAALRHRHPLTPYQGLRLAGRVEAAYLRGIEVYRRDQPDGEAHGRLLERS